MKESTYKLIEEATNDFINGMIEELIAQEMFATLINTIKGTSADEPDEEIQTVSLIKKNL